MKRTTGRARGGGPDGPWFRASVDRVGGSVTGVSARGDLDMATAGAFGTVLAGLISTRRPNVVIDASELRFCDSAGLAVLELAGDLAEACGGLVTLVGVRPLVARVLRITGLDRRFLFPGPSARATG
ncbi:hypothetical protein GCM10023085_20610 [Actinomadura viridis]|uniref:Anti-sigma factor antagonist n=1 Tax=Actinomadura viridis TaxID=58110 RepID=A0A931DH47_9ACTN|nr:STAS domain-containing protein [Actinomadura viridis]MBG6089182.1 anti-sigma B factor antagonist [Actinomadura viridis]